MEAMRRGSLSSSTSPTDVAADATSPLLASASSSLLEQPWAAAEAARSGEASAPPLVDIGQFKAEWQRHLAPLSPRVDHIDRLLQQHRSLSEGDGTVADGSLAMSDELIHALSADDAEQLVPLPHLSCDDIFIGTSRQQIQAAIEREMEKEENRELLQKGLTANEGSATLMMRADIPSASTIAAEKEAACETLLSLKEKEEAKAEVTKGKKRKDVNYLTPNMGAVDVPFEAIDSDEAVVSVAIYHHKKQVKIHEFLVLGDQKLSELRDKITCVSDLLTEPKSHSGFFFFENVFYDDMRDPANFRYSTQIIEWANKKAAQQGATEPALYQYRASQMEETTWGDLKVRIGVPYLYSHQGNCEHRVIITDIRLATKSDPKNRNEYPVHIFQSKVRRKKCTICDIYPATRLTYNDELSPQNPCFFCDRCYRPFHYSFEGHLLRDHDVFEYHHE